MKNLDKKTVESFGDEWIRFDQSKMENKEALKFLIITFQFFHLRGYQNVQKVLIWVEWKVGKIYSTKSKTCIALIHRAIQVAKKN